MTDYSLSHLITDFIVHLRAAGRAENTIASYHQDLQRLAGILCNIKAQSITDEDIGHAVVKIAVSEWNGAHLSLATLNRIKSAYRSFSSGLLNQSVPRPIPQSVCDVQGLIRVLQRP